MALRFFGVYSPWTPDECWDSWRDALRALSANECAALKGFSHQSHREFLVGLRAFLQEWTAARLDSSHDAEDPPAPTLQTLGSLLSGLPLLHEEIVFLSLAGYSQGSIEQMLRITPGVAGEGLARLRASYPQVPDHRGDRCLWPSAWISICRAARAEVQKDCAPLGQLIRILDGQASWYDKSPAEEHRGKCLHCLELWTSLLEVVGWDRARYTSPTQMIEPLLGVVPIKEGKRKRSLFARMLGR